MLTGLMAGLQRAEGAGGEQAYIDAVQAANQEAAAVLAGLMAGLQRAEGAGGEQAYIDAVPRAMQKVTAFFANVSALIYTNV